MDGCAQVRNRSRYCPRDWSCESDIPAPALRSGGRRVSAARCESRPGPGRDSRLLSPWPAWIANKHLERRSEEHTSELQSLMRISYAVFCLKKKNEKIEKHHHTHNNSHRTHPTTYTKI